jgi:hypothetical protein
MWPGRVARDEAQGNDDDEDSDQDKAESQARREAHGEIVGVPRIGGGAGACHSSKQAADSTLGVRQFVSESGQYFDDAMTFQSLPGMNRSAETVSGIWW